ncbi:MAG: hypothetical protein IBJ11_00330 [Phycisphaerales bacterium]|nr:hypothetical protein [Phycisphaerales bacterium]
MATSLAGASFAMASILLSLQPASSDRADAKPPRFPEDWVGVWRGPAVVDRSAGTAPLRFTMEMRVAPTSNPDRYAWTIVYDAPEGGAQTRQERKYELVAVDAAAGKWRVDEKNGIVLDVAVLGGRLYGQFEVGEVRITTTDRLEVSGAEGPRWTVEMITTRPAEARETGGDDAGSPKVTTWLPVSVQRAEMARVRE